MHYYTLLTVWVCAAVCLNSDPAHGKWSKWTSWNPCSVTCGWGNRQRHRQCMQLSGRGDAAGTKCGGNGTTGNAVDKADCILKPCAGQVDGGWSRWSQWLSCSCSCGDGTRIRHRSCSNPRPKNGGLGCFGRPVQMDNCWGGDCPVNGGWTAWRPCVDGPHNGRCRDPGGGAACVESNRFLCRSCAQPSPQNGGRRCRGILMKKVPCWILRGCPKELVAPLEFGVVGKADGCVYVKWKTAPYGKSARRHRLLVKYNGTKEVTFLPLSTETLKEMWHSVQGFMQGDLLNVSMDSIGFDGSCSKPTVAVQVHVGQVDGGWGGWSHSSSCSVTCGFGTITRIRQCDSPRPEHDGKPCVGEDKDKLTCFGNNLC